MYGLVLEGGGARGSYHIGAYQAIMEEGLEISAVAGTSIGALNGAMIVQGEYERCRELWNNIDYSMVINTNYEEIDRLKNMRLDREHLTVLSDAIRSVINSRGFDISPLKDLLNDIIDEDKILSSPLGFGMVTVNLTDFKAIKVFKEEIPKGELKNYLLASAYLPVFKSEKLGGKRYLDGAFFDNLPFGMLKSKGYNKQIIVRTHARGITRKIDADLDAIVISPAEDIGSIYEFEHDRARRNIEIGYYDGLKAIRGLRGSRYYIEPIGEEKAFNMLNRLSDNDYLRLRNLVRAPNIPDRRTLFEYIIPRTAVALGMRKDYSYEDFIIALLERKADHHNIDRFKVYSFDQLLDTVRPMIRNCGHKEQTGLIKILEKADIAALFNKEDTILEVADIFFCNK